MRGRGAFGRPDQRPVPQLHRGFAFSVVRRSEMLTPGQKLLWGRMLELDRSAAGVFEYLEKLAADVGLEPDSCRKLRKELLDVGLLHVHRVKTATGVREFWYCTLPIALDTVPALKREIPAWIASKGQTLDRELGQRKGPAKSAVDSGKICHAPRQSLPPTRTLTSESQTSSPLLDSQSETVIRDCEVQTEKGVQQLQKRTTSDPETEAVMQRWEERRRKAQ